MAHLWFAMSSQGQDADLDVSCLYCHTAVVAEVKVNASRHWEAGTRCEACHGVSTKHLDAEDNSVKPDRVWNSLTVHNLCKECHGTVWEKFRTSLHARLLVQGQPGSNPTSNGKAPNCSRCHGFHALRSGAAVKNECLSCHANLPAVCSSPTDNRPADSLYCRDCHESHSLARLKKR